MIFLQLSPPPLIPPSPSLKPTQTPTPTSNPGIRFREKVLYLQHSLQVDPTAALSLNPTLRSAPLSSIISVADFLSTHNIPPPLSARIFRMYPHLLTCNPHSDLLPVLKFLLGPAEIPFADLSRSVLRCPRLLVSSVPNQLLPALLYLRRLGFRKISSQTALLLVSSVDRTLAPKIRYIQDLGFTYGETVTMVSRSPALLTFSLENNFKPKVGFLVGEMGREVAELKGFPHYFSFSLERKIMPRHRMLVESGLERRRRMSLAEMLTPSDGEFRDRLLDIKLGLVGEEL